MLLGDFWIPSSFNRKSYHWCRVNGTEKCCRAAQPQCLARQKKFLGPKFRSKLKSNNKVPYPVGSMFECDFPFSRFLLPLILDADAGWNSTAITVPNSFMKSISYMFTTTSRAIISRKHMQTDLSTDVFFSPLPPSPEEISPNQQTEEWQKLLVGPSQTDRAASWRHAYGACRRENKVWAEMWLSKIFFPPLTRHKWFFFPPIKTFHWWDYVHSCLYPISTW